MKTKIHTTCAALATLVSLTAHADIVDTDNRQSGTSTTNKAKIGNLSAYGSGYSGLSASNASDYAVLMDSSNTYVNAPSSGGVLYLRNANNTVAEFASTWAYLGLSSNYTIYNYATNYHYANNYFYNPTYHYGTLFAQSSGGNVPHACRTTYVSTTGSATVSCGSGEISTGGGGYCGGANLTYSYPTPFNGANATTWNVGCSTGTASAYAMIVCCAY